MNFYNLITTPIPKIHSCDNVDIIINELINCDIISSGRGDKKINYYNIPCAFDIETTSFYERDEKKAIMYVWQLGLNGHVVVGRTWCEFINLIDKLVENLNLSHSKRLIIYVHNLSYEFQCMRKWLKFNEVFAIDSRKVVKAVTIDGIEFRCSYILTGKSLKKVGDDLNKYKIQKMVGDLDYTLMRNCNTILSKK